MRHIKTCSALLLTMLTLAAPVAAQTARAASSGKPGGVLKARAARGSPQGFAIHETATIGHVAGHAVLQNLVIFDPLKPRETHGHHRRRSWPSAGRGRTTIATWSSSCASDVKWHDGQPFTSKDVKYTFDMVREAPDAPAKLRLNPRKEWYANVEADRGARARHGRVPAEAAPALAAPHAGLRATRPIYPPTCRWPSMRTGCVGTGPFKLKEWRGASSSSS